MHLAGPGPATDGPRAVLDLHRLSGGERVAGPLQEAGGRLGEGRVDVTGRGERCDAGAVPGEDAPVPPDDDLQQGASAPRGADRDQGRRSRLEPRQGADLADLHAAEGGELIGSAPEPLRARFEDPRELALDPAVVGRQDGHHAGRDRRADVAGPQGLRDGLCRDVKRVHRSPPTRYDSVNRG